MLSTVLVSMVDDIDEKDETPSQTQKGQPIHHGPMHVPVPVHSNDDIPWPTTVRQRVTPYLPPPVVSFMKHTLDPTLEPFVGPEGTVTLVGTLLMGWLVVKILSWILRSSTGTTGAGATTTKSWGAIQDLDDENDPHSGTLIPSLPNEFHYDNVMVFCGPPTTGKTSLVYALLRQGASLPSPIATTVSSILPTTGLLIRPSSDESSSSQQSQQPICRFIDIPGHWSPSTVVDTTTTSLKDLSKNVTVLVAVVMDATQPVNKPVDYLYAWIQQQLLPYSGTMKAKSSSSSSYKFVVVGNKADSTKAKNIRRLKLQVKQELERLHQLNTSGTATTTTVPVTVNWDQVLKDHVEFISSSAMNHSADASVQALQTYLATSAFQ